MVGELIVSKDLPTLSTDMLRTNNIIEVPIELYDQWHEMELKRAVLCKKSKEEYEEYFYESLDWYRKNIEDVYLEDEIRCRVWFNYTDKAEVMLGIEMSLFDCDISHYAVKDIENNAVILKRSNVFFQK